MLANAVQCLQMPLPGFAVFGLRRQLGSPLGAGNISHKIHLKKRVCATVFVGTVVFLPHSE